MRNSIEQSRRRLYRMAHNIVETTDRTCNSITVTSNELPDVSEVTACLPIVVFRTQPQRINVAQRVAFGVGVEVEAAGEAEGIGR
jgi:hypothetical protein